MLVALQKKFVASSLLRIAKCKTPNTATLFCTFSIFPPLRIAVIRKKGHFPHKKINQNTHLAGPPRSPGALAEPDGVGALDVSEDGDGVGGAEEDGGVDGEVRRGGHRVGLEEGATVAPHRRPPGGDQLESGTRTDFVKRPAALMKNKIWRGGGGGQLIFFQKMNVNFIKRAGSHPEENS